MVSGVPMIPVAPIQYRKCDRLCERMLVVLVCLFCLGLIGSALLGTLPMTNLRALQQVGESVAKFILWPLLILWLGANGVLVFWQEALQQRSPRGQTGRGSAALCVAVLVLGLSAFAVVFALMAWALKA